MSEPRARRLTRLLVSSALALLACSVTAHARQLTLTYVGDVEGAQGVATVTYEDLRIPAGSPGWWAANYPNRIGWAGTDGRIDIVGQLNTGVALYNFNAEVFGTATHGYGDMWEFGSSSFRILMEWPEAATRIPLRSFDLTPNPILDGTTTYRFVLASIAIGDCYGPDDCAMMLGASLPQIAAAPNRRSRAVARRLGAQYRNALRKAVKAAYAKGRRQRALYRRTRATLAKLRRTARRADLRSTLNVDLAPIESAVEELLALIST